jgi:hypothetical protein
MIEILPILVPSLLVKGQVHTEKPKKLQTHSIQWPMRFNLRANRGDLNL